MAKIINESSTFSPAPEVPEIRESQNLDAVKDGIETYNAQAQKDLMETQEALQKEVEAHVTGEPEPDIGNAAGDGDSTGVDSDVSDTAAEEIALAEAAEKTDTEAEETTETEHGADDHVSGDDTASADGSGSDAPEVLVKDSETAQDTDEFTERPVPTEDEQREMNRKAFDVLKKLPYIDLYNQLQDAQKQVHEMLQMHDAIAAYSKDSAAGVIASMNEAERNRWKGSVREFRQNYRSTYVDGRRLVKFITAMIQCYDGTLVSSTSFISKSMVESAKMRRDAVERREVQEGHADNKDILLRRIDNTISAYEDRIHYPTLINKMRYPNNILDLWKTFFRIGPEEVLKYIDRVMSNQFNDVHMGKFRNVVGNMVTAHETQDFDKKISKDRLGVIVFFMTYWLATVYEKEFESGKCAEVKTLVMAVYDCDVNSRIYDMPGGPALVESFIYLMFTVFLVITSGSYSAKQMHREVGRMFNDLLKAYDREEQYQITKFPGTTMTKSTDFESSVGGSFEDVDAMVDYNEKIPGDDAPEGPVYKLVKELPDEGDAAPNTIYLKATKLESGEDGYEQWTVDELGWSQGETIGQDDGDHLLYGELPDKEVVDNSGTSDMVYRVVNELPAEEDVNIRCVYLIRGDNGRMMQFMWINGWTEVGDVSDNGGSPNLTYKIVDELPAEEDIDARCVYFVRNGNGTMTEFMWIDDWTKVGDVSDEVASIIVNSRPDPVVDTIVSQKVDPVETEVETETEDNADTDECDGDSCPIIFPDEVSDEMATQNSDVADSETSLEVENHRDAPEVETSPESTETTAKPTYVIEDAPKNYTQNCVVDNEDPWDPTAPGNPECIYWIHNSNGNYTPMVYDGSWKVHGEDMPADHVKDMRHIDRDWPGLVFSDDLPENSVVMKTKDVEATTPVEPKPRGFGQMQQPPQKRPVN